MSSKPSVVTIDASGVHTAAVEARLNQRPIVRHVLNAAKYLGLGALVHAWLIGPEFEPNSLWSWGYLIAWPVPLGFWLLCSILVLLGYAALICVVCGGVAWTVMTVLTWREDRDRVRRNRRAAGDSWLDPR